MKSGLPLLLAVALASGCKVITTPIQDPSTRNAVVSDQKSTSYTAAATPAKPTPVVPTPPKLSATKLVPTSLRTEGYDWYGLDDSNPVKWQETIADATTSGTALTELTNVTDGRAEFSQTWSGDLANLPTIGLEARPDGIYITSFVGVPVAEPSLDFPADPHPGKQWTYRIVATPPTGGDLEISGTDKIIGVTTLQIGKKQYQAMEVEDDGIVRQNQKTVSSVGHKWLVKGIGYVKMVSDTSGNSMNKHIVFEATG